LKSLEPNGRLIVTNGNVDSVSLLAREFSKEDLVSECSRIQGTGDPGPSGLIPESNPQSSPVLSGDHPSDAQHQASVTNLANQVRTLSTRLNDLETAVAAIQSRGNLNDIEEGLHSHERQLVRVTSSIAVLENDLESLRA
jgi:hypothetical protein